MPRPFFSPCYGLIRPSRRLRAAASRSTSTVNGRPLWLPDVRLKSASTNDAIRRGFFSTTATNKNQPNPICEIASSTLRYGPSFTSELGHGATAHVRAEIACDKKTVVAIVAATVVATVAVATDSTYTEEKKEETDDANTEEVNRSKSYQQWIKDQQTDRNASWKLNVAFDTAKDTEEAPHFPHNTLFHNNAEKYASSQTSTVSNNIMAAAKATVEEDLFAHCMVGSLESQFLKMMAKANNAHKCLDIGCFTGSSAIAFAEGALAAAAKSGTTADVEIHTLESDGKTAEVAAKIFGQCEPKVQNVINLHHGDALSWMKDCAANTETTFDICFIDADKDNYLAYYSLIMGDSGMRPLLAEGGMIMADNTLSALVYDEEDSRRKALHLFNQHVKNDARVEQCVLTVREGVTLISRV
mmetsp:Transcript_16448/g.26872  ORF Transcript_16448/g.26872 Transcript_16448/m.26872 type:complete len:414 (+) Transcript_16448:67-1308(+)